MTITILPGALDDLLALQEYMLDKWSEADWLVAEEEIFGKLALVENGFLTGAAIPELASVGIFDYQSVFTSHHKLVYRRIHDDVYVFLVASHKQDFPALLMKRMLKI